MEWKSSVLATNYLIFGIANDGRRIEEEAKLCFARLSENVNIAGDAVGVDLLVRVPHQNLSFLFASKAVSFPTDHRVRFVWKNQSILPLSIWHLRQFEASGKREWQQINYAPKIEVRRESLAVIGQIVPDPQRFIILKTLIPTLANTYALN